MKHYFILPAFIFLLIMGCGNKKNDPPISKADSLKPHGKKELAVKRMGMVTGIQEDKIGYYKQLHAAVWPGVLQQIQRCNIRNYSIYIQKINQQYFLFSYFEYTGNDFDGDMKKMAADTLTQHWWKETAPTQAPLPEALAKQQVWAEMEEVFHTN